MKFRKIISVALCVAHLSLIFISCGENNISTPKMGGSDNIVQVSVPNKIYDKEPMDPGSIMMNQPGMLHNEILQYFNKDNILVSGNKMEKEEVVARMVEACNQAFLKSKIEYSVTEEDITFAIQCLDTWRERGIFDVFTPINKQNIESVYRLLDHLAYESGNFKPGEIENIKMAFKEVEAVGISNCDSRVIRDITSPYKSNNKSTASYRALDILENSFDFWSNLKLNAEEIEYEQVGTEVYIKDSKLMVDTIGLLLADAIGALLCWNGGPLTVICAVLASIAYFFINNRD